MNISKKLKKKLIGALVIVVGFVGLGFVTDFWTPFWIYVILVGNNMEQNA